MKNLKTSQTKKLSDFFEKLSKDENFLRKFLSLHSINEMYEYAIKNSAEKFSFLEFVENVKIFFDSIDREKVQKLSDYDTEKISGGIEVPESTFVSVLMFIPAIIELTNIIKSYREKKKKLNDQLKNDEDDTWIKKQQDEIEKEIKIAEAKLEFYKNQGVV